jgi:hypothetical protein
MQRPTWLKVQGGVWVQIQRSLGVKRRRSGRRIGRGKARGKSVLILFCAYPVSLPKGFLYPPVVTEVKSVEKPLAS